MKPPAQVSHGIAEPIGPSGQRTTPLGTPSTMHETLSTVHNVGSWIARWSRRRPNQPAWSDDAMHLSYAEAEQRIQRLTAWLLRAGIQPRDRIALWLGNRSATLECLFACARLGAIALPINARLTPAEVAFQLGDCRPELIFVEPTWRTQAEQAIASSRLWVGSSTRASSQRLVGFDEAFEAALRREPASPHCAAVRPDDPMLLMYTSGTTGHPKGAVLPHRKALFNSLNAQLAFELRADDRVLVVAPLFHSLGLQILALPALYAGASLRLQEGFDAERVWRIVAEERVTFLGGVPTMHQRLLDALEAGRPSCSPPPSLRLVFTAGAAAARELIEGFDRHGLILKQGYGQTETSILTCLETDQALSKAGSVGRPVFHAEIRLIAPETIAESTPAWRDVEPGEVGEVVVRGPTTMLGYWERPEATAETLRDGWLRTGDLATRDADFDITLVGRIRELYISGGENVYPAEIEATLIEHPAVAEAAVVAVPDLEWGEVGRAHVVLAAHTTLEPPALLAWLETRLARFKIPRQIVFERALPRTASGKVQKHRLVDPDAKHEHGDDVRDERSR